MRLQAYSVSLRQNGAVITTTITMACAKGVMKSYDSNILQCNGGHILLTKHWAKYHIATVSVSNFNQLKA